MTSLDKFGQFVRHQWQRNGWTQLELSVKIFGRPRCEFIGRLERGTLAGITFTTTDKTLSEMDAELEFKVFEIHRTDYIS